MIDERMRANKALQKLITDLVYEFSSKASLAREVELRRFELGRAEAQLAAKEIKRRQLSMEVSLFIYNMNVTHNVVEINEAAQNVDEVFLEDTDGNDARTRMRATLHELNNIVNFLYSTDSVQDISEEQLANINQYIDRQ